MEDILTVNINIELLKGCPSFLDGPFFEGEAFLTYLTFVNVYSKKLNSILNLIFFIICATIFGITILLCKDG